MTREIKFRAWDMRDDKWLTDYYIVPNGQVLIQYPTHEVNRSHTIALMQYTGLKDKNGVEIYEGDIVDDRGYRAEVKATISPKGYCYDIWFGDDYDWHGNKDFEVIGNIYENKDLLND